MKTDHLPAVTFVQPCVRGAALPSLTNGGDVAITPTDRVTFAPLSGVLLTHGRGFAVPTYLHAIAAAMRNLKM